MTKKKEKETDTYFKQIYLDSIDDDIISLLDKAVSMSYYGFKVSHILPEIANFNMQLWEGKGHKTHFIAITQMTKYPGGTELVFWSLAGKGYIRNVDLVYNTLAKFAQENNCRWFSGKVVTEAKALEKVYEKFGVELKYKHFTLELDNVTEH